MSNWTASRGQIVNAYIKALFSLAQESHQKESILHDFHAIQTRLEKTPLLLNKLSKVGLKGPSQKEALLNLISDLSPLMQNFINILYRNHRLGLLSHMIKEYETCLYDDQGILSASVEVASAFNDTEKDVLRTYLENKTGKEILLFIQENPRLIGGFKVVLSSILIDCSTRARIEMLQNSLRRE